MRQSCVLPELESHREGFLSPAKRIVKPLTRRGKDASESRSVIIGVGIDPSVRSRVAELNNLDQHRPTLYGNMDLASTLISCTRQFDQGSLSNTEHPCNTPGSSAEGHSSVGPPIRIDTPSLRSVGGVIVVGQGVSKLTTQENSNTSNSLAEYDTSKAAEGEQRLAG